jgi:hypothetical protein
MVIQGNNTHFEIFIAAIQQQRRDVLATYCRVKLGSADKL